MTKGSKKRLIERIKSLLIVVLSCSAIFLTVRTQAVIVNSNRSSDTQASGVGAPASPEDTGAAAHPLRMAAAIHQGNEMVRYGVQYDQDAVDTLFQQASSLLLEALSSASQPQAVDEERWQAALTSAPGLYFDWQGELPLTVLTGWLSVNNPALTGTVRRMALTAEEGQVLLYYWDESSDRCFMCTADVISGERLVEVVSSLQENGAQFAFETEEYSDLSPYTMILPQNSSPAAYSVSNPLSSEGNRRNLQEQLGFPENSVYYEAAGELVIRNRNDTLHLADDGLVIYEAAAEGSDRYRLPSAGLYDAVEGCRQLVQQTLGQFCGAASLYLMSVAETGEGGWQVEFGYSLNGVQVRIGEEGWSARFVVEQGQIIDFQLCFRNYTDSRTTSVVLPERQAMAAMAAAGHSGEELLLVYLDNGGEELISASWAAIDNLESGR